MASRILAAWNETGRSTLTPTRLCTVPSPYRDEPDRPWVEHLIGDMGAVGLTGRGGAGFPTARKLGSIHAGRGHPLLAVNAMEGEPASQKDRALLAVAPHLVLDGAELVATAIGAREIALCVADDRDDSAQALRTALAERVAAGLGRPPAAWSDRLGATSPGRSRPWLRGWLADQPIHSSERPRELPSSSGGNRSWCRAPRHWPTSALIARYGPQWFRSLGIPEAPGTCLVTLSGPLASPGVREVVIGTPITDIFERAAGITDPSQPSWWAGTAGRGSLPACS